MIYLALTLIPNTFVHNSMFSFLLIFYQQQFASFFVDFSLFNYCTSFRLRRKENFIRNSAN